MPEQKARSTYDNILRVVTDPDVCEPIRFLRKREIVHFQRFGEALRGLQEKLDSRNFYAFNPSFFFFTVLSYFTVCFLFFCRVHGKIKILLNKKIHKTLNFTVKIPGKKVGGADAKQTVRKGSVTGILKTLEDVERKPWKA